MIVTRLLAPIHDRLVLYVLTASAVGLLVPDTVRHLAPAVPVFLAGQVAGVALTLEVRHLVGVLRRPLRVLAPLAVQWTVVPAVGLGLAHVAPSAQVADGLVITAASPAEITSALVAVVAGGSGEVGITLMVASIASATLLTPAWVQIGLGSAANVGPGPLVGELALCVALPLAASLAARHRLPALAGQAGRCLDIAAVSVVLVVGIAAAQARDLVTTPQIGMAVVLCLALLVTGYLAGAGIGRLLRVERRIRRAVLFPVGMREFGIAATVALAVRPEAAAIAGVYGILVMLTGPALAGRLRRRDRRHRPALAGTPVVVSRRP